MTKSDLNLIEKFIDTKNPKRELNYAYLGEDGIYATDTRIAIHFHASWLGLNMLLHKKLLKGFISALSSDSIVSIDGNGFMRANDGFKISCDTWDGEKFNFPDMKKMFNVEFKYKMTLEDISDLHFELSQRNCFVDDARLYPVIEFGDCKYYEVFFNEQVIKDNHTNTGLVKIVGIFNDDEEVDKVKFTALIMGREFQTKTQEQLLLDL
jgi:hypothetical protein